MSTNQQPGSGRMQYIHGYGENLIDYNRFNQTLGLGFELSGWL
ncbi:MAG: phospholipase A [Saccharospirillum sp.]|nr:phospholipase A [Saccharospirillum sp.]